MKPTLKENYRYISLEIHSDSPILKEDLIKILQEDILTLVGKIHYPKIMPKLVYFDYQDQKAIVRCLNEGTEDLKTALAMINKYGEKRIHLRALFTSGTIRKAKERLNSFHTRL